MSFETASLENVYKIGFPFPRLQGDVAQSKNYPVRFLFIYKVYRLFQLNQRISIAQHASR